MQSFKQFLLKENSTAVQYKFDIDVLINMNGIFRKHIREKLDQIERPFFKKYPKLKPLWVDDTGVGYEYEATANEAGNYDFLTKLRDDVFNAFDEFLTSNVSSTFKVDRRIESNLLHVTCDQLPSAKINYDLIALTLTEKCTLSGIDTIIGEKCRRLELAGLFNVTGNVLGLLRIKSKPMILGGSNSSNSWIHIVKTHASGDRDILQCQEDLIEAGLEEYGKF